MTTQRTGIRVPKAVWHKSTVHTYCDICIRAIEKSFRPHTHFSKQGWDFIVKEFGKETRFKYGQKQLKNKWDALKKDYKLWKDLMRNETGLGWDTEKNTIGADDAWWEEKIRVNPSFGNFRFGGIEPQLEDKLELMFSTIVATGEFTMSPGCNVNVTPREEQDDVEGRGDSTEGIPIADNFDVMFEGGSSEPILASNKRTNVEIGGIDKSSMRVKKMNRRSGGAAMLAKHIETLVGAVSARSSTVTSTVAELEVPSLRATVADIKTIPGIDINSDLFMFATEFMEEKAKREVYLELESPEHKLNWLTYHFIHKGSNKKL